ncbi:MAG: DUF2807 domain-containing protein [Bacteroidia bacterium]|nr:DUF2807 domain-containing protein [Bacteroidia bacterium]
MAIKKYILIPAVVLIAFSCSKENRWDCLKRTGKIVTEERVLNNFTDIEIMNKFTIEIIEDSVNKAIIKGGENLLPLVKSDVSENKLVLKNNNRCNWARSYSKDIKIELHVKKINNIYVNDLCDITSANKLHTETMYIEVNKNMVSHIDLSINCTNFLFKQFSGTGTYTFKGVADSSYYFFKGTGYIYSNGLQCNTTHIVNQSTGDIHVVAAHKLFVEYTGKGDVYYSGNPQEIVFDPSKSAGNIIKE